MSEYLSRWPLKLSIRQGLQTASLLFMLVTPIICFYLNILFILYSPLWPAYAFYLFYIYAIDYDSPTTGSRKSYWWRSLPIFRNICEYFPSNVIVRGNMKAEQQYIFAMHPHGVMAISAWTAFLNDFKGSFSDLCPGIDVRLCTLNLGFYVPFMRELLLNFGMVNAEASTIHHNLSRKKSILIMVGGSEEAYHAGVSEYEELILSKRKGFVRIALETGTPIVPVYGFGENDLYTIIPSKHPYWQKFQSFFKSLTKYPISVVNGRGIGNFEFGILPRRVPLTTVLGEPIIVPKIEKPSQEEIDEWHSLYIEKLKDLYRDYKGSIDDLVIL